jgi:hypothetical protein
MVAFRLRPILLGNCTICWRATDFQTLQKQLELGERIGYDANIMLHLGQLAVRLYLIHAPNEAEIVATHYALGFITEAIMRKGEKCFVR